MRTEAQKLVTSVFPESPSSDKPPLHERHSKFTPVQSPFPKPTISLTHIHCHSHKLTHTHIQAAPDAFANSPPAAPCATFQETHKTTCWMSLQAFRCCGAKLTEGVTTFSTLFLALFRGIFFTIEQSRSLNWLIAF